MSNNVQCGYLDNLVFDFNNGKLPIDEIYNNKLGLFNGLTWKEQAKIVKYYSLACKHGANSVYHLKMAYVVAEIIRKYYKTAKWHNKFITVSSNYW